jgi:BON domain
MKPDMEISDDVIAGLRRDPQIPGPANIGVAVSDGAVTLTGHAVSYADKLAAARAAERVYGVKAVVNDIEVRLAGEPRDDSDIAKAIAHVLEWNVHIPSGRVQARARRLGDARRPDRADGPPRAWRDRISDTLSLIPAGEPGRSRKRNWKSVAA